MPPQTFTGLREAHSSTIFRGILIYKCNCRTVGTRKNDYCTLCGFILAKSLHLLQGPKHEVDIKLSCKPLEISAAVSQHLNTVEIKCEVYGERVRNVLAFLSKLNICKLTDITVQVFLFLTVCYQFVYLYEMKCLNLAVLSISTIY